MTQRSAYEALIPDGIKALGGLYLYITRCGLPKTLVDLVYLRASQINGCAYCIDVHTKDLMDAGVSAEKLALLPVWREGGCHFSEREAAALAWAETVTCVSETHVPDDAYRAVLQQFDEKSVADLTLAIGLINTYNRMAISFRRTPPSLRRQPG